MLQKLKYKWKSTTGVFRRQKGARLGFTQAPKNEKQSSIYMMWLLERMRLTLLIFILLSQYSFVKLS